MPIVMLGLAVLLAQPTKPPRPPNVVLIVSDDQGYGDLSIHGNPVIRTPNLDALAKAGVRLDRFHVSPVCAPTRASLLTGRYNYRTGVVDTYLGRALMHPEEVTLAELLAGAGYRTGIFGKWHLGDNYPLRPTEQGFQEALVLRGGGIGQPSDPPGGSSYFDPILFQNGAPTKTKGYVSDVLTDAAIRFVEKNQERPFFAYLAFNCPHTPLEVPERYLAMYRDLDSAWFAKVGGPSATMTDKLRDDTARVYGMVTNIDENVGRLLAKLDELKLAADTLVVFLTDNGPQQPRFNANMRQRKGSVYDGGIRVPCFWRWPGKLPSGRVVDRIAAHIDVLPSVLDACGVSPATRLDGRSLLPLLKSDQPNWPDRNLFFQWHRGEKPELYRAFAVRSQRYKLVQPLGAGELRPLGGSPVQLFDMQADPEERHDLAADLPEVSRRMQQAYVEWFTSVSTERGFDPPRIVLGHPAENPVTLTRQDWRGRQAGWGPRDRGHWEVRFEAGSYQLNARFAAAPVGTTLYVQIGDRRLEGRPAAGQTAIQLNVDSLAAGSVLLSAWLEDAQSSFGVNQLDFLRLR